MGLLIKCKKKNDLLDCKIELCYQGAYNWYVYILQIVFSITHRKLSVSEFVHSHKVFTDLVDNSTSVSATGWDDVSLFVQEMSIGGWLFCNKKKGTMLML